MFRRKLLALEYPQPDNFNTEGTPLLNYFPPKGKNDMWHCSVDCTLDCSVV